MVPGASSSSTRPLPAPTGLRVWLGLCGAGLFRRIESRTPPADHPRGGCHFRSGWTTDCTQPVSSAFPGGPAPDRDGIGEVGLVSLEVGEEQKSNSRRPWASHGLRDSTHPSTVLSSACGLGWEAPGSGLGRDVGLSDRASRFRVGWLCGLRPSLFLAAGLSGACLCVLIRSLGWGMVV